MDPVQEAEQRIRDLVNSPRRAHLLRQDRDRWFKLCSSMDSIGDTQLAVRAFIDEREKVPRSDGWSYVIVYGLLQAMYVQQDAARALAQSLNLPFDLPEELKSIREARNASIGHPTNYRGASSTAISRISLSADGFQMLVFNRTGPPEFRNVSVRHAAEQQTTHMAALLRRAAEYLVQEELEHRRKFRDTPLSRHWSRTLGYMVEKIGDGLREGASIPFAIAGIESIRAEVAAFRASVDERGIGAAYEDSLGDLLASIDFVLERLTCHFKGQMVDWDGRDGDVYWYYLHGKLNELRQVAEEIDAEYAADEV